MEDRTLIRKLQHSEESINMCLKCLEYFRGTYGASLIIKSSLHRNFTEEEKACLINIANKLEKIKQLLEIHIKMI